MGQRSTLQANYPKLPVLPGENHILISSLTYVPNVLPVSYIYTSPSWHAGWCSPRWTCLPVLFSLYANDIPTPSRHVELAQYADDSALVATSRTPPYLGKFERQRKALSGLWRVVMDTTSWQLAGLLAPTR
jgi:hypothetical protein